MILTIGHSNQSMEAFLNLLALHQIEVVVDVRSYPFCRYAKHFDTDSLKDWLLKSGFKYLYLGKELGGKPKGDHFYDSEGNVIFSEIAQREDFQEALDRIISGSQKYRIALTCGEENPTHCHRRLLLTDALLKRGITVLHIRGTGELQTDSDLDSIENDKIQSQQLSIFNQ